MVTLRVFLFSGQCIDRVMRLVVWPGVVGCMTSWGMSYSYVMIGQK